jgi:hypothetical protein
MPNFVPYEPEDVSHLDAGRRRREIQEWLRQQLLPLPEDSPPIVPNDVPEGRER